MKINRFNISEREAVIILDTALMTGAEFAEVYFEDTIQENTQMTSLLVTGVNATKSYGAAMRIIKNGVEVNGMITKFDFQSLVELAKKLSQSFTGEKTCFVKPFVDTTCNKIVNPITVKTEDNQQELRLLTESSKGALEYSKEITQVISMMWKKIQHIAVFASDGTWAEDFRCNSRLAISAVASDENNMESIHTSHGANQGMEFFDGFDAYAFGKEVAYDSVQMLHAEEMPGGEMPVVLNNGFGGVILHEACVHGLEATSVAKGMSVFCGKLGTKVASDIVNAVDDGTNINAWGSINVDDEGTPSHCNVLIENGILKSYLVDKKNAKRMNHHITGSSRRQGYKNTTTSRMTNTYFLNGNSTFDEIIKNTKYGLFAKSLGGGSVQPATGEFNFSVEVGYLIENGKITRPVKGATLIGSGKDVLLRIDMIGDNLSCGHGMCGSESGSIPTNVGQPTLRVSSMTVGGKGGNK